VEERKVKEKEIKNGELNKKIQAKDKEMKKIKIALENSKKEKLVAKENTRVALAQNMRHNIKIITLDKTVEALQELISINKDNSDNVIKSDASTNALPAESNGPDNVSEEDGSTATNNIWNDLTTENNVTQTSEATERMDSAVDDPCDFDLRNTNYQDDNPCDVDLRESSSQHQQKRLFLSLLE